MFLNLDKNDYHWLITFPPLVAHARKNGENIESMVDRFSEYIGLRNYEQNRVHLVSLSEIVRDFITDEIQNKE